LKISVSLPDEDLEFLDSFRQANGLLSRSAVVHLAIYMLRGAQLTSSYEAAWGEWQDTPESADWAVASTPVGRPPGRPASTSLGLGEHI
jgi:Arc/MetJ-type ribon-helix-helix transcriptional regulator